VGKFVAGEYQEAFEGLHERIAEQMMVKGQSAEEASAAACQRVAEIVLVPLIECLRKMPMAADPVAIARGGLANILERTVAPQLKARPSCDVMWLSIIFRKLLVCLVFLFLSLSLSLSLSLAPSLSLSLSLSLSPSLFDLSIQC
jgi:hypothetical protein